MKELADSSVDSVVTDPPYELGFMGKKWDSSGIAYDVAVWVECLRVLKPGGHLLAFGGSRTYHRLACAIEDAGFEIRDQIQWIYGSGFPKSLDVSKAIDSAAGAGRNGNGAGNRVTLNAMSEGLKNRCVSCGKPFFSGNPCGCPKSQPFTDAAKQWDGWGTALKPAHEPIVLARKPLIGTVAENVLRHGTGGLNIDGCRIEGESWGSRPAIKLTSKGKQGGGFGQTSWETIPGQINEDSGNGRWPANVIHDGSEEVLVGFPETAPSTQLNCVQVARDPKSSAARFFYCAKASKEDRDEGLEGSDLVSVSRYGKQGQGPLPQQTPRTPQRQRNHHPTVKPTTLMRYLCRLVTPPNGIVLDPFCGSGSTGKAAILEGLNFIGIELNADYCELAEKRIAAVEVGRLKFS